ncbi:AAA family ATPase, partial [Pseudomonas yangonensis]|uniref:AAA family ATPase n=1 Tax=Pseudomonas yangonensis TaxID=2579922 RepID=UPI0034D96D9B
MRQCEQEKGFPLRDEQVQAMLHATDGKQISIIQGAAGTGKSASLAALNIAYSSAGPRV